MRPPGKNTKFVIYIISTQAYTYKQDAREAMRVVFCTHKTEYIPLFIVKIHY